METRLIVAYLLIGLLAAMAALFARQIALRRREHRRLMRGRGAHNRPTVRRAPTGDPR
jgi:hypothetical protein